MQNWKQSWQLKCLCVICATLRKKVLLCLFSCLYKIIVKTWVRVLLWFDTSKCISMKEVKPLELEDTFFNKITSEQNNWNVEKLVKCVNWKQKPNLLLWLQRKVGANQGLNIWGSFQFQYWSEGSKKIQILTAKQIKKVVNLDSFNSTTGT